MKETWLPVVGYEGRYSVSSHGRVRNDQTRHQLKPQKQSSGHLAVGLSLSGSCRIYLVHRLMAFAFLGDPEPKQEVLHWDDVPDHNEISNLRWGTRGENALDKVRNGHHHMTKRVTCPSGHALAGHNLVARHAGRKCRSCANARAFAFRRKVAFSKELADSYYERYSS